MKKRLSVVGLVATKLKKRKSFSSLLFVALLTVSGFVPAFLSTPALAAFEPAGWLGAEYGLSVPSYDDTTSRSIYGITAGAKLGSEYGLGVYYLSSAKTEDKGKFNYDLYGVEFGYHFEGEARGAYFGGRLGTSKLNVGNSPNTTSTSPFHWGVMAGYNYFLIEHFSLGGEFNFMSISSSSADGVALSSFTALNFMLNAKFWF